ncbi:MAG: hypothetical protein RIG84_08840 [Roseovarius sp.]
MRFSLLALLVSTMLLSACGGGLRDSRINPANWFGRSTSTANETGTVVTADGEVQQVNPLIGEKKQSQLTTKKQRGATAGGLSILDKEEGPYLGTMVDQVTSLSVERTSTGAIVKVTGVTARQGAYDVRLVEANNGTPVDGVLTYELRALQPLNTFQGPEPTRRIEAGAPLTMGDLEMINSVRVVAKRNTRTTRR